MIEYKEEFLGMWTEGVDFADYQEVVTIYQEHHDRICRARSSPVAGEGPKVSDVLDDYSIQVPDDWSGQFFRSVPVRQLMRWSVWGDSTDGEMIFLVGTDAGTVICLYRRCWPASSSSP